VAGGTAPGLLNCASRAARLAVGVPDGAGAAAGGMGIGVDMAGGDWNGGGWKGAGAGTELDCAGVVTRLSSSAKDGVTGGGVGCGCGVCCTGGLKLASSCATFGGALPDGVPVGGNCGGKFGGMGCCEGYPFVGVGGGYAAGENPAGSGENV
jgi:hypothetical protein